MVELRGTPASAGKVRGIARVVRCDPNGRDTASDTQSVRDGEILVCNITTPVWTTVFGRIGGVVAEEGGILSHPAIVAREHKIPAVVGCPYACVYISTGALIEIDGSNGSVIILGG